MRIEMLLIVLIIAAIVALSSFVVGRNSFAGDDDHAVPKPSVDLPPAKDDEKTQTAVFAGGCFWCTEGVFQQLKGVIDVTSGYAGGTKETADYETVSTGSTRHAESVRIIYDPHQTTYGELLWVFFSVFNPTTLDQQGPDHGPQYRTAIFYENPEQKKVAELYIKQIGDAKVFKDPIVTTVEPIGDGFFPAEKYHQDYVDQHPDQPYITRWALPKIEKVRDKFKDKVKDGKAPTTQK